MDAAVGRRPSGSRRESHRSWYSGIAASITKSPSTGIFFITKRVPPLEIGIPGSTAAAGAAVCAAVGAAFCAGSAAGLLARRMPIRRDFAASVPWAADSSWRCEPAEKSALNASIVVWPTKSAADETASAACGDWKCCGSDQVQLFAACSHDSGSGAAGGGTRPAATTRSTPFFSAMRTAGQPPSTPEKRSTPTTSEIRWPPPPISMVLVLVS